MLTSDTASELVSGAITPTKGKGMAKVKTLVGVVASGFDCKPGEVYELDDEDALLLIRMGKAVPVEAKTKKVANREEGATKVTRRGRAS